MCVKFQVNRTYGVEGRGLSKIACLSVNYSATMWPIAVIFREMPLNILSIHCANFHVFSSFHLTAN